MLNIPEWTIMLYDQQNQPIMDISDLASINLNMKLNDIATLDFSMDLKMFERKCAAINTPPRSILYPATTEIRAFRNGNAMFGGIISGANSTYDESGSSIDVQSESYLQYFAYRLNNKTYRNMDRSAIAWDAINTAQSEPNGNLGVTLGTTQPTFNSDLDPDYRDVKSIIQRFTYVQPVTYDFEITPDKVFNTYRRLGSERPDIQLIYPQNIRSIDVPRSSDTLYNRVIGIGSGIGRERLETRVDNGNSQITYRIRETKETFNDVKQMSTLENNAAGILDQSYEVQVLPNIRVDGKEVDLDVLRVGDSVFVRIDESPMNDDVNGMYRIYEMTIAVDQNSYEQVTLGFYKPDNGGAID